MCCLHGKKSATNLKWFRMRECWSLLFFVWQEIMNWWQKNIRYCQSVTRFYRFILMSAGFLQCWKNLMRVTGFIWIMMRSGSFALKSSAWTRPAAWKKWWNGCRAPSFSRRLFCQSATIKNSLAGRRRMQRFMLNPYFYRNREKWWLPAMWRQNIQGAGRQNTKRLRRTLTVLSQQRREIICSFSRRTVLWMKL